MSDPRELPHRMDSHSVLGGSISTAASQIFRQRAKMSFPVSQLPKPTAKLLTQSHWMQRPAPIPTAPCDHPTFVWDESKLSGAEQVKSSSAFVHSH